MIGVQIENRGAFLKMATDAAALDGSIREAIKALAREYDTLVRSMLSRGGSGRLYGARQFGGPGGRQRYRVVRKRTELFGGKKALIARRVAVKQRARIVYRASAPGQPPASFTGNLLRAVRVRFPSREKGYGAKVFANRGIGGHRQLLEFGTGRYRVKRGPRSKGAGAKTHMMPRPIWTPLQRRALDDLQRRLLRVIDANAAFRGGA
jgi:hypothetical protein